MRLMGPPCHRTRRHTPADTIGLIIRIDHRVWQAGVMCGRYATSRSPHELVEDFDVEFTSGPGPGADPMPQDGEPPVVDYNAAPTKSLPVVIERAPRRAESSAAVGTELPGADDDEAVDEQPAESSDESQQPDEDAPVRWLRLLTWGLVPSWAKDRSVGYRMINARSETLLDKTFRRAALTRRCLVPADGWYEWQRSPTEKDAKGRPRKQPFFMAPIVNGPIAFAGVYEFWRDSSIHPDEADPWLTTFSIITTEAEPGLSAVHDRMPLVLPQDRWSDWLNPEDQDEDSVRAMLSPPAPGRFTATPVSTRVNSVKNNGPELLAEVPRDQLHGVLDPATGELIGGGDVALF